MSQQDQRDAFQAIVVAAMEARGWSAVRTAEEAGISEGAMTNITNARPVKPFTVAKVRRALGIEPLTAVQAVEGYDRVIEVTCETVAMVMSNLPQDELKPTAHRVIAALFEKGEAKEGR